MKFSCSPHGLIRRQAMNVKLLKYVQREGYCCLWAWLEANRSKLTSVLMKELEGVCTVRALRYHRADHRRKETACSGLASCLKERIKAGHTIVLHPRKEGGSDAGG